MKTSFLMLVLLCFTSALLAQEYFPNNEGIKSKNNNYTAFINAKIVVSPTQEIAKGSLLIKEGKIVAVGTSITIPKNSVIIDLAEKTIYPSFIDIFSDFGVKKPVRNRGGRSPQYKPTRDGYYWNDHIKPENNAITSFRYDVKKAIALRKLGFGVVNTHIQDGIARGTGLLVALSKGKDANRILDDKSAQYFSLKKSITSKQSYPTSLMGSLALLRQFYSDAEWYAKGNADTKDRSIEAHIRNKKQLSIFEAKDKGNVLRADKIGDAQNIQYIMLGGGNEFEWIADIKKTNASFILPLNFPDAYDVSDPYSAKYVSLKEMRLWKQRPSNPKIFEENAIPFSFTLHGLANTTQFKGKLLEAINAGLSKTKALAALTTVPAQLIGKTTSLGTLEKGKWANFIITSGDVFKKETLIYENWVQGSKNSIHDINLIDIRGKYDLNADGLLYKLIINGKASSPKVSIKQDTNKLASKISLKNNWLQLSFTNKEQKTIRFSAFINKTNSNLEGRIVYANGKEALLSVIKTTDFIEKDKKKDADKKIQNITLSYPNTAYGYKEKPKQESFLFKNATVWTSEDQGILKNTDVLVKKGIIVKIGSNLNKGNATLIDATGKHLTAGIIDEHSHIALLAVNEAGQNSSAEVKMEDVVDPEDVAIYRSLAGGVTSMQLLHGSANPIGGRSAIIKLKWGASAKEMIYNDSPKFIKFALGENVKQSNWSSYSRFPQTRMGVEQAFENYFQQAKEYSNKKKAGLPYRYDEEMEVLSEILDGNRFISCHSYVQSEINMLMKVATKFGFRINTFTHILEGYKVADKMKEHGVGASTFSDWWAYKYEVKDAIPYNAAIMQQQGITVAINSDDEEMARRLNQEAAKTVKYGGVSEEEAWKMVTINPASLLHINHRVGSIKEGKDADLVLWSNHPLSVYAKAEKTLIEGAVYFDKEKDLQKRTAIKKERNSLIQEMLNAKAKGKNTQLPKKTKKQHFHCNTI